MVHSSYCWLPFQCHWITMYRTWGCSGPMAAWRNEKWACVCTPFITIPFNGRPPNVLMIHDDSWSTLVAYTTQLKVQNGWGQISLLPWVPVTIYHHLAPLSPHSHDWQILMILMMLMILILSWSCWIHCKGTSEYRFETIGNSIITITSICQRCQRKMLKLTGCIMMHPQL